MSKENKWILTGIIVVVVIIIIYAIYSNHKSQEMASNNPSQNSPTTMQPTATTTPTSTPTTTTTGAKLSYGDAIKAYPERFQFSNTCKGTPATIAVKKGTPVMLDNRNATAITIKADTDTFRLAGYGYDVFYPTVLGNLTVTCNGKNSVTLNVEK